MEQDINAKEKNVAWRVLRADHPGFLLASRADMKMAIFVVECALILAISRYVILWRLEPNGLSPVSLRLPYWDFTNLWAGSRFAWQGNVEWLFDVDAYRAALRSLLNPDLPSHEWSYPPSILLLGVPLSWFPIFPAYLLFICATLLALHVVLKPFQFPFIAHLAILLGPPGMISITFGQNGNLTGALMIGALAFSQRRPWLAGMMAGLLTIKPQLGILLPIAYLAAGNWKAIFSAILTAVLMALATGFFFGFHVWLGFLTATAPLMSGIMNAPFPQDYQVNSVTFFITARYLGFDVPMAHLFQAFFTLAAMLLTFMIWRPPGRLDIFSRSLLTTLLVIMATPYGYSYDMVPYSVAVAWWFMRNPAPNRLFFAALWLFPAFAHIPGFFGIGLSILVPAIFIIWVLREEGILFGAKPGIAAG